MVSNKEYKLIMKNIFGCGHKYPVVVYIIAVIIERNRGLLKFIAYMGGNKTHTNITINYFSYKGV